MIEDPIFALIYFGETTSLPVIAIVLRGLTFPVLNRRAIVTTSWGLIYQTDSPLLIGSIWWIWTPTFPQGWGPEKIVLTTPVISLKI